MDVVFFDDYSSSDYVYMLYRKCGGKLSYLEFRLEFIENFCQTYEKNVTTLKGRRQSVPHPLWIIERHF